RGRGGRGSAPPRPPEAPPTPPPPRRPPPPPARHKLPNQRPSLREIYGFSYGLPGASRGIEPCMGNERNRHRSIVATDVPLPPERAFAVQPPPADRPARRALRRTHRAHRLGDRLPLRL